MDGTLTGKRRDGGFLEKLWIFLDDSSIRDVIYFSPNGEYLIIEDPDAVPGLLRAANICSHKDYASFQRVMTIYGWKRLTQTEMENAVLVDGEEPGTLTGRLASRSRLMRHATLDRDSSIDEVKAVTRNAKPKASRAKHAGIVAAVDAVSSAAALARLIGNMSTISHQPTSYNDQAVRPGISTGQEQYETSTYTHKGSSRAASAIPSAQNDGDYRTREIPHLPESSASFETSTYPHTTRLPGASYSSFAYSDLQQGRGIDSSIATSSHSGDQQESTWVKAMSTASASSHSDAEAIHSKGEKPAVDRYATRLGFETGEGSVLHFVPCATPDGSNYRSPTSLPSRRSNHRAASTIFQQPLSMARTELSYEHAEAARSGFSGSLQVNTQYAPLSHRQRQTNLSGYRQPPFVHHPRHHL